MLIQFFGCQGKLGDGELFGLRIDGCNITPFDTLRQLFDHGDVTCELALTDAADETQKPHIRMWGRTSRI